MTFHKYQRIGQIEARPYVRGDQATHNISISEADLKLPTLVGGMVARNPDNHDDMWYIAADYFAKHYALAPASTQETRVSEGCSCMLDERTGEAIGGPCPGCSTANRRPEQQ